MHLGQSRNSFQPPRSFFFATCIVGWRVQQPVLSNFPDDVTAFVRVSTDCFVERDETDSASSSPLPPAPGLDLDRLLLVPRLPPPTLAASSSYLASMHLGHPSCSIFHPPPSFLDAIWTLGW